MRIDDHPLWEALRPLLYPQRFKRAQSNTRELFRIEIHDPETKPFRAALLGIEINCVTCERLIHPVRARIGWGTLYLVTTCDLPRRLGCSRHSKCRVEVARIVGLLQGHIHPKQVGLF
jgi:hypothetical protein